MDDLSCIVHYNGRDAKYSKIKPVSSINKTKINAAKSLRESLGGVHHHKEQCDLIPETINETKHGILLKPRYKKFTIILSQKDVPNLPPPPPPPKRKRLSGDNGAKNVYRKECNFCKTYRIKHQQKICLPITVCTEQAVNTIIQAAEANEVQTLFFGIKDLDLIAKEFKYHECCYKDFTRKEKHLTPSLYGKRNFEKVKVCIEEKVLTENQAVSMHILHDLYGLSTDDTRYRSKLKARIQSEFTDKLHFVFINETTPEVLIGTESIKSRVLFNDKEHLLNQAAEYLRADIEEHSKNLPEHSWPINIDELDLENRSPPESVTSFLSQLLRNKGHPNREALTRLKESQTSDLIHGVTRGKVITTKHFLLGLGLHNITGQSLPIQILHRLGHCIDYNFVCEIETAQAETAQMLATESGALPLKPASRTETVLAYFWVDNFDTNLETQTGKGALNSTHLVAFQEESQNSVARNNKIFLLRKKGDPLRESHKIQLKLLQIPNENHPL